MTQEQEIERLKRWVADLQSGMYVNCVYCGHRYGPKDRTPATMADMLKLHVAECPAHPMSQLLKACWLTHRVLCSLLEDRDRISDEALREHRDRIFWAIREASSIEHLRGDAVPGAGPRCQRHGLAGCTCDRPSQFEPF